MTDPRTTAAHATHDPILVAALTDRSPTATERAAGRGPGRRLQPVRPAPRRSRRPRGGGPGDADPRPAARLRPDAGRCRAAAAERVAPRSSLPSGRPVTASAGRWRSVSRRSAWPACWSRPCHRSCRCPARRPGAHRPRRIRRAASRPCRRPWLGAAEGRASSAPAPLVPAASAIADAPTGPRGSPPRLLGCARLAGSRRGRLERVSRRAGGPAPDPAPPGRDHGRRHEGVRRRHERCRARRRRQQPRVAGGHRRFDAARPVRRPAAGRSGSVPAALGCAPHRALIAPPGHRRAGSRRAARRRSAATLGPCPPNA